jgi:hypothetical protein
MPFFTPSPPITEDEREWIELSMLRLIKLFGFEVLRSRPTILPDSSFFPERYTPDEDGLDRTVKTLCRHMDVPFDSLDIYLYSESEGIHLERLAAWESSHSGSAGRYSPQDNGKFFIGIESRLLAQPTKLVATIAHELCHVLLLGGGRIDRSEEDHEHLTDLLTVFLGIGLFTANAAFEFNQWQGGSRYGWSTLRQGYMSQPRFGYALAAYCWMRGDKSPQWERLMTANVREPFRRSMKYLIKTGGTQLPSG